MPKILMANLMEVMDIGLNPIERIIHLFEIRLMKPIFKGQMVLRNMKIWHSVKISIVGFSQRRQVEGLKLNGHLQELLLVFGLGVLGLFPEL